jgi:hypothetical protein
MRNTLCTLPCLALPCYAPAYYIQQQCMQQCALEVCALCSCCPTAYALLTYCVILCYVLDSHNTHTIGEYVQKGTLYTCALSAGSSVFAVGNDRVLKELEMPDLAVVSIYTHYTHTLHTLCNQSLVALRRFTSSSTKIHCCY